jgi:glycosyltransferase involved in cell wall biosynthesis
MSSLAASQHSVAVVICTHNPRADYLKRTLAGLQRQTLPAEDWTLIIVDNCSSPAVEDFAATDWHPASRIVRESALGLTSARLRAIRETTSDVLVFVDDDNVLEPNYLEEALRLVTAMPMLGCLGAGQIVPEYEETPQSHLNPYLPMLALRTESSSYWSNDPKDRRLPWGAGMVVTRKIADAVAAEVDANQTKRDFDRKGNELNSCGDDEFSWISCRNGLGYGIFPELKLVHLIPVRRIKESYLLQLAEGHAYSRILFAAVHGRVSSADYSDPSMASILLKALTCRFELAARELLQLASDARLSVTDRAFRRASRRGAKRAMERIKSLATDG